LLWWQLTEVFLQLLANSPALHCGSVSAAAAPAAFNCKGRPLYDTAYHTACCCRCSTNCRENGPLEAGWGIAAMARALELVRSMDTSGVINNFLNWVNRVPMQDMLYYTVNLTSKNLPNQYGNCECATRVWVG
jgi:hypothetical protein